MDSFKDKNILILGLGLNQGGVGSAQFLASQGAIVKVTDLKSKEILESSLEQLKVFKNISYTLGEHKLEDIDWADIVIRNPAIKDNNPYLEYALKKDKKVETDFSIFLNFADQKKIIAVTGTKGKSTTASLIFEVIKASGKKVVFAGNIGKSILDTIPYLKEDPWIVVEISSFQLQALKDKNFAPKIAVITNIYPDHLNWHSSMEEYIQAKKMVALKQSPSDFLVIFCTNMGNEKLLSGISSSIYEFCPDDFPEDLELPLKGYANLQNYAAALSVAKILEIDDKVIYRAFKQFKGAPFRMEFLGKFNGINIFNDSTATNPVSTITALETLGPVILITGGMNKGMDYTKCAEAIRKNTKSVFFLEGDATSEIQKILAKNFRKEKVPSYPTLQVGDVYNNLVQLLTSVKKVAKSGDTILFSPGATSFNLFQNEFDRGRKFNEAVKKVFEKI